MKIAGIEFPGLEVTGHRYGVTTGWKCRCGWKDSSGALIGPQEARRSYDDLRIHARMCPEAQEESEELA